MKQIVLATIVGVGLLSVSLSSSATVRVSPETQAAWDACEHKYKAISNKWERSDKVGACVWDWRQAQNRKHRQEWEAKWGGLSKAERRAKEKRLDEEERLKHDEAMHKKYPEPERYAEYLRKRYPERY